MWVPACLVYIIAGLVMFAGWLRQSEAAAYKREAMAGEEAGDGKEPDMSLARYGLMLLIAGGCLVGCDDEKKQAARAMTGGDPDRGEAAIYGYGLRIRVIPFRVFAGPTRWWGRP